MHVRHLLRAGALAALLFLVGASLASALPLHPAPAPTTEVGSGAGPGLLSGLWDGLLGLLDVEAVPASGAPASPPRGPTDDGGLSSLDGGDETTGSSDDGDRNAGLDPDG